ncbi:hypothetical protein ACFJGV_07985 [Cnuibacter sp. UC19_7]|uniref:hypothetical protein n=1 Tax=Cnuibacter sp. UC19_7 TaxID=3350166 RepID=UPI00366B2914
MSEREREWCEVCDFVAVRRPDHGERVVDIEATQRRLGERLDDGRMRVLRADVPLADMMPLAEADLKYTIVLFARCETCGTTWFHGLCIRGRPVHKPVEDGAEERWPWEEVPARELWAS